jgi:hypothetical protein
MSRAQQIAKPKADSYIIVKSFVSPPKHFTIDLAKVFKYMYLDNSHDMIFIQGSTTRLLPADQDPTYRK